MRYKQIGLRWLVLAVVVSGALLGFNLRSRRWRQLVEMRRGCLFPDVEDLLVDYGDFTKVPLDGSPYLRDVVEPISITAGPNEAASDSVFLGIEFIDAKQVERHAEYLIVRIDIYDTVMLGKTTVPPCGPEEQAFLGLLQRWYRQDREAQGTHEYLRRADYRKDPLKYNAKVMGIAILKKLLERN